MDGGHTDSCKCFTAHLQFTYLIVIDITHNFDVPSIETW